MTIKPEKILTFALLSALMLGGAYNYKALAAEDDHGHAHEEKESGEHGHGHEEEGHEEGALKLLPEQMSASGISLAIVRQGDLSQQVSVPGRIVADADRMAQIVSKVSGVVIEARKNLGDKVGKGEVLALIESREMAEAAAEYQAAQRSAELARTTHNREQALWKKKVTAEQDYLSAKNAWQEAQIRLDLARQKMETLGGTGGGKASRYHELKSPLDGLVVERDLTLGEFVDTSKRAFTVADLSVLWVETSIAPDDLVKVREGQKAVVQGNGKQGEGTLIFVSPVINPDTRSAKVIVELDNPERKWRSGDYVSASIITDTSGAGLLVPQEAVQTIEGKPAVFVKTAEGFEKREIVAGKKDGKNIEVSSGLHAGEEIAVGNTFILKAEVGKSEVEHSH